MNFIVSPAQIEEKLQGIWESLSKEHKTRASIFNLIVFNQLSDRTDYFRNIVQKVVEKFPCRILFISEDPDSSQSYLKTAISVVSPQPEIACDQIDIGVSSSEVDRVPFVLLPHLLPDLPIYLLWAEDPSKHHPLFQPLLKLAKRAIFDSEAADDLNAFSQTLLSLAPKIDVADLNWARTEGWRELFTTAFDSKTRLAQLLDPAHISITYNQRETPFFCHLKTQALYLLNWLSSRLNWKQVSHEIREETWSNAPPGTLLSIQFRSRADFLLEAKRRAEDPHRVNIEISTKEQCELPYTYALGQTAMGHSLVKEICTKGTSSHFLQTLQRISPC